VETVHSIIVLYHRMNHPVKLYYGKYYKKRPVLPQAQVPNYNF
jgi:hypothetical protein